MDVDKIALEMEQNELNLLIKKGLGFDIITKIKKRESSFVGFFKRTEIVEEVLYFKMHEPTLSVLDRLSEIWLQIVIDEDRLQVEGCSINEAKKLIEGNPKRMALIVAIAVLGEDYYVTEVSRFGRIKKYNDDKELGRLADLFYRTVKPSKLYKLSQFVTAIANIGDFLASMRLMSGARTTQPKNNHIE